MFYKSGARPRRTRPDDAERRKRYAGRMKKMESEFIPLLFAGDINVYSVARAFHEAYGVKPKAYGKAGTGVCPDSRIMDYTREPEADQGETLLRLVNGFADKHRSQKIILIGCGDAYVRQIIANKPNYADNVIAPYISLEQFDRLTNKEHFYALCEESGIAYPDTFIHRKEYGRRSEFPFDGPFIVKPSDGIAYWAHPFPGQNKVFKTGSRQETDDIIERIYASGYDGSIVVQNFIPGDDTYMRVLTNYSDRNKQVRLTCHGHVLLEEHTPKGSGNHAVIITERNEPLETQLTALLNRLGYTGFSNFDIKYDQRDGKYKVFELNARQGRSNYYVTGAGANIAHYLVDDLIREKDLPMNAVSDPFLWMIVPKKVAFDFIGPARYRDEMRRLIREGKWANPLLIPADTSFTRRMRVMKNLLGHHYKFRKYYKPAQN
jgi:D-aspartate ligase